ncbi:hypothetical protein [Rhodohalobacter barkolensis]|uniref:Uncharacterized protein n=1 Tax=Rhodohalobacter barkolensis TaxID=2053187 RepID=A0A2N0VFE0_9BACT|nr:hypothetical protein [Rhodohalobacter barkolensis]PKD42902.1 hypothetical protein CWD77_12680 [Rhodohalobacter barkolensis]
MLPLIVAFFLTWLSPVQQSVDDQNAAENGLGNRIALSLDSSINPDQKQQILDSASQIGIDLIHFTRPEQLNSLNVDDFFLIYQIPLNYSTVYEIQSESSEIIRQINESIRVVTDQYPGKVAATGLLRFPNEAHPQFTSIASQIASAVRQQTDSPLFYQSALQRGSAAPEGFDFFIQTYSSLDDSPIHSAVYFEPDARKPQAIQMLEKLFSESIQMDESVIIIPADWFVENIVENQDFTTIFAEYLDGNLIPFPIPYDPEVPPAMNWNVIFLFLILGSVLLHMRYQPVYTQALPRYFFNHSFFLIDVMEHRIRNVFPGIVILVQHAIITGIILYLTADSLFNSHSLNALTHHFPILFWSDNHFLSLFIVGFIMVLFMQALSVLWLHLPNKKLQFFSQTLNLYAWPLHINFLVATILIVLFGRDPNESMILTLLAIYLFVWFMSFNIAAFDGSKFMDRNSLVYILLTIGLHTLLFTFLIWITFYSPSISEPLQMALSFSH